MPHRKKFIIPVFLPEKGCPHKCVYCNQKTITGEKESIVTSHYVIDAVYRFASYAGKERLPGILAFYGGNFLGISEKEITVLLEVARRLQMENVIDAIRFSTRPDTITKRTLDLISEFSIQAVELGVQSMDDSVLKSAARGHTAKDVEDAVILLKKYGFVTGLQMMIGLPDDSKEKCLATAKSIALLDPAFTRIYPTLVIKGSPLEQLFKNGKYNPISLKEAVFQTADAYEVFESQSVPVIRMGLQAGDGLVPGETIIAGPYHPAFGELVFSEVFFRKIVDKIQKSGNVRDRLTILTHPGDISKVRGQHNANIQRLKECFGFTDIRVLGDERYGRGGIEILYDS